MKRFAPVLWAVLVLLVSLPPLAAGYSAAWTIAVLAACTIGPFGIAAAGRAAKVPRWVTTTAGLIIGVVVALVFAARVDEQSAALPGWRSSPAFTALGPLIDSVPRLLTAARPAPPDPSLVVPAALLVWIVALGVAMAVVGSRRAGVAPLFGAVVVHVAGALLTAGRSDALGISAVATTAVLLLGWVFIASAEPAPKAPQPQDPAVRRRQKSQPPRRRGVLLSAITAVVVASFAVTAAIIPTANSFEPRTLVPPPQLPADAVNPVPQSAVWALNPQQPLFTMSPVAGALPERVSLAVLPDYTGVAWMLDARLRPVGVVATADTAAGAATREATYTVTNEALPQVWIPSAGTATAVTGAGAVMDLDTGTLVAPTGWLGQEVTVTTTLPSPTDEARDAASVPVQSEVARYLEAPRVPTAFVETARSVTTGASSRWQQVQLLSDWVRNGGDGRVLDHGSRSGSSYARLGEFLFAPAAEGGQVGTTEQFAGSFAVLARTLGIPTRLVVGFEVPGDGSAAVEVTGAQSRVWAEVYLANVGWVAVDPSPDSSLATDVVTPDPQDEVPEEATADPTADPTTDPPVLTDDTDDAEPTNAANRAATGVLVATGVIALVMLGLAVARGVRRRRWRAAGDRGAWAQVEDSLLLAGVRPGRSRTAPTIAAALPDGVSAGAVAIAERAEEEAFGPVSAGGEAGESWAHARQVDAGLRKQAPWHRRLLWWVSPRVWRR